MDGGIGFRLRDSGFRKGMQSFLKPEYQNVLYIFITPATISPIDVASIFKEADGIAFLIGCHSSSTPSGPTLYSR